MSRRVHFRRFRAALLAAAGLGLLLSMMRPFISRHVRGQDVPVIVLDDPPSTQASGGLPVFWNVPPFSYVDQTGQRMTEKDLLGKIWVADFIFTQCTSSCPTMTAKMVIAQHQVSSPDVRFVSFSVDPAHDTPDALKQYAARWNADETRWHLLSTDEKSLPELARDMNVVVHNTPDPENPIMHSNLFFLIDAGGKVRGIYNSGDSEAMDRLPREIEQLLSGNAGSSPQPMLAHADGKTVYSAMGCAACHNDARLGPPLTGLLGHAVMLDGGGTIQADQGYLRESILDPPAKIVAGYKPTMPSYRPNLSDEQVTRLVQYIADLRTPSPYETEMLRMMGQSSGPATAPSTQPFLAVDPVCKMEITVTDQSPRELFNGKTYYFCSDDCHQKFVKEPQKYAMK